MLFKILHGEESRISTDITPFHEGYCYVTHDGNMYVDINVGTADSPNYQRKQISENFIKQYVTEKTGDIVELALAEAKASGEFDGEDGMNAEMYYHTVYRVYSLSDVEKLCASRASYNSFYIINCGEPFVWTNTSIRIEVQTGDICNVLSSGGKLSSLSYPKDNNPIESNEGTLIRWYETLEDGDIKERYTSLLNGKDGESGVYLGSLEDAPDSANVVVDPEGDPTNLFTNTQISEEMPTADNIKLWVDIDKEKLGTTTSGDLLKNYASELTWINGERWIATSGNTGTYADAHRTTNYINVEANATYRIIGLFADGTNVASVATSMPLGVFKTNEDVRTKGFVVSSNFATWADDKSYCDVVVPENSTRLYLNALYYNEDTNMTDYVKVYKVIDGELEKIETTNEFFETATLKFRNSNGIF